MASAKEPKKAQTTRLPIRAFRMRGISVAVFSKQKENEDGSSFTVYDISVQRRYRDGDEYKTSDWYRRDELPVLQLLVQRAWEFVLDASANPENEEDNEVAA